MHNDLVFSTALGTPIEPRNLSRHFTTVRTVPVAPYAEAYSGALDGPIGRQIGLADLLPRELLLSGRQRPGAEPPAKHLAPTTVRPGR